MSAADYNALRQRGRSKYGNVKTEVDGIRFDSAAEARRYGELKLMEQAGEITDLVLQPAYTLTVNGVPVCKYVGDFAYLEQGKRVVEDVKGVRTPSYRIKRKLMLSVFGIEIVEVEA